MINKVKDLFVRFSDRKEQVIERIFDMFDLVNEDERAQFLDFYDYILSERVDKKFKTDAIVSTRVYNLHRPNYYVDAVLIRPGHTRFYSVDYTDWDEILNSYFVTETTLIDTLAIIIFLMTLISFDEEERNAHIKLIAES